jgi:hypothetical protein
MVMNLRTELDEHRQCVKPVPGSYTLRVSTFLISVFAYAAAVTLAACIYLPVAYLMPLIRCKMLYESATFLMVASLGGGLSLMFFGSAWLVYHANRDQFACAPETKPVPVADAGTPKAHAE